MVIWGDGAGAVGIWIWQGPASASDLAGTSWRGGELTRAEERAERIWGGASVRRPPDFCRGRSEGGARVEDWGEVRFGFR